MNCTSNPQEAFGPYAAMFRSGNLPGMRIELRPIASSAPDNMVGIMYRRTGHSFQQSGVGCCIAGEWRRSKRGARLEGDYYWSLMVNEKDESALRLGAKADG